MYKNFYFQTVHIPLKMHKKNNIYFYILVIIFWFFLFLGNSFSFLKINTVLWILPPPYNIEYIPSYSSWKHTQAPLYVSITGNGIKTNETWIRENWTYTIDFYRGTWPFTPWAWYSSWNTRTLFHTHITINWIDHILPTFIWVYEWATYTTPITITFTDNNPWVTATLNNYPFENWTSIATNWNYQLIVTDAAGNRTWATFAVYLSSSPSNNTGWSTSSLSKDICTLPNTIPCANTKGKDYSPSYYDNTCCFVPTISSEIWSWTLDQQICKKRNCYSSYYEKICGPCTPWKNPTQETTRPPLYFTTPDSADIRWSAYPKERNDAYQRAYKLWITTIPNIKDANLEGVLYRKMVAKMISEFALKVVGITPDETKVCEFNDIRNEDPELQYYIKLSCQLWIMGLDYYGNPDTTFNPNYYLTRDQFVTILSRTLFGNIYNLQREEYSFFDKAKNFAVHTLNNISKALKLSIRINTPLDWYTKHLNIIKTLDVMTDYRTDIKEFRIYDILIMYRMDLRWIDAIQSLWL